MARAGKKIVVAKGRATVQKDADKINAAKDVLRNLKPIGVRFSVTEQDGGETTIEAWTEAPAAPTPRAAAAPVASAGAGASAPAGGGVAPGTTIS